MTQKTINGSLATEPSAAEQDSSPGGTGSVEHSEHMNLKQAANRWGVSEYRARKYCNELGLTKNKGTWQIPTSTYPPIAVDDITTFARMFLEERNNPGRTFDWRACHMPPDEPAHNIAVLKALGYVSILKGCQDKEQHGLDDIFLTEECLAMVIRPKKDTRLVVKLNANINVSLINIGGVSAC